MKTVKNFQPKLLAVAVLIGLCTLNSGAFAVTATSVASPPSLSWQTVVNNGDYIPTASCNPTTPTSPPCRKFNS